MKIQYFEETDTLYIEFNLSPIVETKELDENIILDLDSRGRVCALTLEHTQERTDIHHFSFEQITSHADVINGYNLKNDKLKTVL